MATIIDPLALKLTWDINLAMQKQEQQQQSDWEHNDLAHVKIRVLRGHEGQVRSCQFCYGETKILSSSYDKTIKLWSFETGDVIQTYKEGHEKYITMAKLDEHNGRFVSAGWDKRVVMWDVESGNVNWQCEHPGIVTSCDLSSDGKMVISASDLDNFIRIWDAKNGALLREIKDQHSSTITSLRFSPSSDRFASTSMDGKTKVYDLKTAKTTITVGGHINVVSAACFSPDERWLASVSWDKSCKVWDISTGHYRTDGPLTFDKDHEGSVASCCFSDDGEFLITGACDQSVCLWDIENKTQKLKLLGHSGWVLDTAISKDGKWLLTASADETLRLWDIEDSDNIPVVLEQKKNVGLKVTTCKDCGKPFSVSQGETGDLANVCVFCRLQKRTFTVDLQIEGNRVASQAPAAGVNKDKAEVNQDKVD